MAKRASTDLPIKGMSNWKNMMIDAQTDFLAAHLAGDIVPIQLTDWRLEVFGAVAGIGGVLATDTTPILSQQGNKGADIYWAAEDVTKIIAEATLPDDYQAGTDVVFHFIGGQVGSNDDVDVDLEVYRSRVGAAVSADIAPAVAAANRLTQGGVRGTPEDIAITVLNTAGAFAARDKLSVIIVLDAHDNDAVWMQDSYLTYTGGGRLPDRTQDYWG